MGFLDKVKAQAEQAVKQGQDKLEDVQAKRKADALLRDLGAWYYAGETDRDEGKAPGELARIVGELQAHEAEFGPLGGTKDDEPDAPPPPPGFTAPPPPAASPPVASPPPPIVPPVEGAGTPPPPPGFPPPPGTPPTTPPPPA